jgi:hypothetical protein
MNHFVMQGKLATWQVEVEKGIQAQLKTLRSRSLAVVWRRLTDQSLDRGMSR